MYRGHLCCSLDTKSNEMINEWGHVWFVVLDVAVRCHLPSPQRMAAVASLVYSAEIIPKKFIAYLDHALQDLTPLSK